MASELDRLLVLGALGIFLHGCNYLADNLAKEYGIASSAGGMASADPGSLSYENWITFDRDIFTEVDIVFARLRSGDEDAIALVREFVEPGIRTISDELDISLPYSDPYPVFEESKFLLDTDTSEWSYSKDFAGSVMTTLPVDASPTNDYRWRASILTAEADFNAITPRKVLLSGVLLIDVEMYLLGEPASPDEPALGTWIPVAYSRGSLDQLADRLRIKLNHAYYRYIRDRYDIEITPERFGGLNEEQG